jgi:sugar O-acyltransferase (sialic acid O-acetyltransferase NeuD family)
VTTPLVIIGAGGLAREFHDVVEAVNAVEDAAGRPAAFRFLGFVDPQPPAESRVLSRGPVLGGDEILANLDSATQYIIAISNTSVRGKLDELASSLGLHATILIHPAATVGRHDNVFGPGTVICANATVTTNVNFGRHVHVDRNVAVGHDTTFENYVSVFPGANVAGNVHAQVGVTLGTGSSVIQGIRIGANSIIGAGAVVVRDIEANVTAVGSPARAIVR